jgi:hypothetical protein
MEIWWDKDNKDQLFKERGPDGWPPEEIAKRLSSILPGKDIDRFCYLLFNIIVPS